MNKLTLFIISLVAIWAGSIQITSAQTDSCIIKLKNAGTAFEQGDYDITISLIRSALAGCNLDKSEKIDANKLLILSYLKVDNLEEADNTASAIMKIDPYYKPDKFKDDPKLTALFEKYQPLPMFKMGLSGGFNISSASAENTYSIVHADNTEGLDQYNNKLGFQLGIAAEYRTYKDLWVSLGFGYRQSKYEHELFDVENTTINYSEKLSYFDVPLSLKYYFLKGSVQPYLEGGATFSFLSSAISTSTRDDLKDLVDRADLRNKFMNGYFGGLGAVYSMKGLQLFVNARYSIYSGNVNKEGTRYADPVNVFKYYYLDDDFTLDNFQVNAGIGYILGYKNVKVK